MKKLVTFPYGSRLYGTSDENSDYDWKVLVLPELADLVWGAPIKNVFFSSSDSKVKNTSDDTDTEYIPLQVFAKDVVDGQSYALELGFALLQANDIPGIEVHDPYMFQFVEKLMYTYLTSNINAMVGYAYHQAELYSEKGDRLDKLHQFNTFLLTAVDRFSLSLDDKLGNIMKLPEGGGLVELTDKMLYLTDTPNPDGTKQHCISVLEKLYPENITIREALDRVTTNIKKYGRRANAAMVNQGKDWKAISHAVRIVQEASDILTHKWITLPFKKEDAQYLLDIKHGKLPWEPIQIEMITTIDRLKTLQQESDLPTKTPEFYEGFKTWLTDELLTIYKLKHDPNHTNCCSLH